MEVFFYGLFMDSQLLRQRGLHPTAERIGWVENSKLFVGERAGLEHEPGSRAYGVVMSLPVDEVDALYADDALRSYREERVRVVFAEGRAQDAVCYNVPRAEAGHANPGYVATLRDVARRVGLPEDYVSSL